MLFKILFTTKSLNMFRRFFWVELLTTVCLTPEIFKLVNFGRGTRGVFLV